MVIGHVLHVSVNEVRYQIQTTVCVGQRYVFGCDQSDEVMWFGVAVVWGVKLVSALDNETCVALSDDCMENDNNGGYTQVGVRSSS